MAIWTGTLALLFFFFDTGKTSMMQREQRFTTGPYAEGPPRGRPDCSPACLGSVKKLRRSVASAYYCRAPSADRGGVVTSGLIPNSTCGPVPALAASLTAAPCIRPRMSLFLLASSRHTVAPLRPQGQRYQ